MSYSIFCPEFIYLWVVFIYLCSLPSVCRLDKETKLRIRVEDELKRTERRLHEKESLLVIVSKERRQLDDRVKELEAELKSLEDEVEKQKTLLENEIIKRISAQNRVQTLEEEAAFKRQTHARVSNRESRISETQCYARQYSILGKMRL